MMENREQIFKIALLKQIELVKKFPYMKKKSSRKKYAD